MEIFDLANQLDLQSVVFPDFVEATKKAASARWAIFADSVEAWKKTLDPAIWLTGSVAALVPGSFVIYKWWNYRNSRLPQRLTELLAKQEIQVNEARTALMRAVEHPDASRARIATPLFAVPTLKKTVRNLNWAGWKHPFPFAVAENELEMALVEIERQSDFCEKSRADCRRQEATAFLIKGAIAAARAGKNNASPEYSDRYNRAALSHFNRALEIDQNDIEALEYAAHHQRILGQDELALSNFRRLADLTGMSAGETRAVTSRAHRYRGEIFEKKYDTTGVRARLDDARTCLDEALTTLSFDTRGQIDHAAIHEILGRVCEKAGAALLPIEHYGAALSIYGEILEKQPRNKSAHVGYERIDTALKSFVATRAAQLVSP